MTRSELARYGAISWRRHVWLPSVITSAPAARRRSASFGVMPTPSATFSPLTMHIAASSSARRAARRSSSASLPGRPTTSPTKRMFTGSDPGCRVNLDRHVVAARAGVLRERLPLDRCNVDDRPELGRRGEDGAADGERRDRARRGSARRSATGRRSAARRFATRTSCRRSRSRRSRRRFPRRVSRRRFPAPLRRPSRRFPCPRRAGSRRGRPGSSRRSGARGVRGAPR